MRTILIGLLFIAIFSIGCLERTSQKNISAAFKSQRPLPKRNAMEYIVQEHLMPKNLHDISDKQIIDHWALYKGYVAQVNKLNQELKELAAAGKTETPLYADRRRRYGFEYNGMVLHEYYFGNLKIGENQLKDGELRTAIAQT